MFYVDDALGASTPILYQDSAMTTPVTAVGQPIGWQMDRSGNGNHRIQAVAAQRPFLLRNATTGMLYVGPDGSDDAMTGPMDLSASDKVLDVVSLRKTSDAAVAILHELTANSGTNVGAMAFFTPGTVGPTYSSRSCGNPAGTLTATSPGNYAAPTTNVLRLRADIAADLNELAVNGIVVAANPADQGSGNYSNSTMNYFARNNGASLWTSGEVYAEVIRGGTLPDAATIALVERWAASKAGLVY